jgi:hypothetical protein
LSELWLQRANLNGNDFMLTRQFFGARRGVLRPQRVILISPKLQKLIQLEKLKGCEIEVAHFKT